MTTLPKSLSGAAFMLLATLLSITHSKALDAAQEGPVREKRIRLLEEALVLTRAGGQSSGDRLRATLQIEEALKVLGATPTAKDSGVSAPAATGSDLKASLKKAKTDLDDALMTIPRQDTALANPVIGAIIHLEKALFLMELQERAAAQTSNPPAPAATPAPTPVAATNAASGPSGRDQVQPVHTQQENSGQTQPVNPATSATPAPTNAP